LGFTVAFQTMHFVIFIMHIFAIFLTKKRNYTWQFVAGVLVLHCLQDDDFHFWLVTAFFYTNQNVFIP